MQSEIETYVREHHQATAGVALWTCAGRTCCSVRALRRGFDSPSEETAGLIARYVQQAIAERLLAK